MSQEQKPICAVRGLIKQNCMCGYIIVGGKFCAYKGNCPHQQKQGEPAETGSAVIEKES